MSLTLSGMEYTRFAEHDESVYNKLRRDVFKWQKQQRILQNIKEK